MIVKPDSASLSDDDLYSAAGVLIVLTGAALVVVGYLQHSRVLKLLHGDEVRSAPMAVDDHRRRRDRRGAPLGTHRRVDVGLR